MDIVTSSAHKYGDGGNIRNNVPTAIKQFPMSLCKLPSLTKFPMISNHQAESIAITFI
jgi:hypothetical protein